MKVFNAYLKILKTFLPMMIMYCAIFLGINMLVNASNKTNIPTSFEESKTVISIIDNDQTTITKAFTNYMKEHAKIVELKDNEESLKDALFYRQAIYIIKLDDGFTDDLLKNKNIDIEVLKVPDAMESMHIESLTNNYFNIVSTYIKAGFSEDQIIKFTKDNLSASVDIVMSEENTKGNVEGAKYYFNFTYYILMALTVALIGMLMAAFNNDKIRKRTMCSPVKMSRINGEVMLGNVLIASTLFLVFVLGSLVFYQDIVLSKYGLLFILNLACIMLPIIAIALLIGNLVKDIEVQNAIQNVLALGTAFLCGVFVPQEFLGDTVLTFAKILPPYWFVLANEKIADIATFNMEHLQPVFICMLIQIIFAIAIYLVMILIQNRKRQS